MTRQDQSIAAYFTCLTATFLTIPVAGEVILTSQLRRVSADGPFASPVSHETPAEGDWTALVQSGQFPLPAPPSATSSQVSAVSISRLAATSNVYARDDVNASFGTASSSFRSTFAVTDPALYVLTANWQVGFSIFGATPAAEILLQRLTPDPSIIHLSQFVVSSINPPTTGDLDVAGILSPGTYRLTADLSIHAMFNPGMTSGDGSLSMEMLIPSSGTASICVIAASRFVRRRRAGT